MAFHHLAGVTTPGAPDEIVDWFATFEAWITGTVGWIIASGAGTTDLRIRSLGEAGGLTMLFLHIWRGAGANIDRVYVEVSDDAIPTHETTEGGYVDSGGVQFGFWMSADLDALAMVWKVGAGYRFVYGGLLMPFALNPVDETNYSMAASAINTLNCGSILHRHDGLWDQDDSLYEHAYILLARRDRDDGSLPIGGVYFADQADTAGQLKHVTCEITDPATNAEDTLDTGEPLASTSWIVLQDSAADKFAMRTGGVLPTGRAEGNFAHATGAAANIAAWYAVLVPFMQGRGWTATDVSGASPYTIHWEFNSAGEDGTDDIWLNVYNLAGGTIFFDIADSAYGTPGRHATGGLSAFFTTAHFPTNYYLSGDADCLCATVNAAGAYVMIWGGRFSVFANNLSSPYMRTGVLSSGGQGWLLRAHTGNWRPHADCLLTTNLNPDGGFHAQNSQPNLYDGTTYLAWPWIAAHTYGGAWEIIGQMKYAHKTHGGGVANLDTITIAGRVYTVFFPAGQPWAMRTT